MAGAVNDTSKEPTSFSAEDAKELREVLGNKSVAKALEIIQKQAESMDKLSTVNLLGQEGLSEALARQGMVRGILLAIQTLKELGEENVRSS